MKGGRRRKAVTFLDLSFWLGSIIAMFYGYLHILDPSMLSKSWGLPSNFSDETSDFVRLLGIWILFQSLVAATIPLFVNDMKTKLIFAWIHVLKNFGAFFLRYRMYISGRYSSYINLLEPTQGFMYSLYADLFFGLLYLSCCLHYAYFGYKSNADETKTD